MPLRDYQSRAVDEAIAAIDDAPIIVSPTGSGKTTMGVEIIRRLGRPALWVAHRRELITQARDRLIRDGINPRVICAAIEPLRGPYDPVTVASVQTLFRRETWPDYDLAVVDECHHDIGKGLYARLNGARKLGLTATPFRLDGNGLGGAGYGRLIVAAHPGDLIDAGHIIRPTYYAPPGPDMRRVKIRAGEFEAAGMFAAMAKPKLIDSAVDAWKRLSGGQRTVLYAVNVEHSIMLIDAFRAAGIPAEHLDGTTPKDERSAILRRLESGDTLVVSNCMVLTEGWDLPPLAVASVNRPTASLCLHLQMIGRIVRPSDGKRAIVLDHAGNTKRHGLAHYQLDYSLDDVVKHKSASLTWTCPECFAIVDNDERVCPECGYDKDAPENASEQKNPDRRDESVRLEVFRDDEASKAAQWAEFESTRRLAGFKPGWTAVQFKSMFGHWPRTVTVQGETVYLDPSRATRAMKEAKHAELFEIARARDYSPGWIAHRYKDCFGVWPRGVGSDEFEEWKRAKQAPIMGGMEF